jgi:hypothetical protein
VVSLTETLEGKGLIIEPEPELVIDIHVLKGMVLDQRQKFAFSREVY